MPVPDVRDHYERYPYPCYPLLSSVRRCDTYALNLQALWARFNGEYSKAEEGRILIAGSGSFAPYPMSVANPDARVTALDLSEANLNRARLHCLLHFRRNVSFVRGDLLDPASAPGPFHFIDSFGVIHHLEDPLSGLRALEQRLVPGGILRVMVYGRYARKEAESIRHAVTLLWIKDIAELKRLLARANPGSRVREYLEMVGQTGLRPLLFAHRDALADPAAEIERLRELDRRRETPTNIICYLGLDTAGPCTLDGDVSLRLNPSLSRAVSSFRLRPLLVAPRLGQENPIINRSARAFLRRFRDPAAVEVLTTEEEATAQRYLESFFLVSCKSD